VKGFGRRPLRGRSLRVLGPAFESPPRRKPRVGRGADWSGATYGDLKVADEALVRLRGLATGIVRGGNEDDELFCGGCCEARACARRLEKDWRACEDVAFLPRRAAGDEGDRHCEAGCAATVMSCRS